MASAEHEFVSECFIQVASEMAVSEIFSYTEADRQRFDFACHIEQHRERLVMGQTLQSHAAGIEKDLSLLLLESDDSVPVYLFRHSAKHLSRIGEVVDRSRDRLRDRVELLRLYPYPDFDADDEADRIAVLGTIRSHVVDDLLLNVVFGRLSAGDVRLFMNGRGIPGLQLAALEVIATKGFTNFPQVAQVVGVNPTTLRPRVANLLASGMLATVIGGSMYWITQRGRVFLRICSLLAEGRDSAELRFILERLGVATRRADATADVDSDDEDTRELSPLPSTWGLLQEVDRCRNEFGLQVSGGPYLADTGLIGPGSPRWVER